MEMAQVFMLIMNQLHIQTMTMAGTVFGHFDELVTMQGADDHHINIQ